MLPYVIGGVLGEILEDLEVERLERGSFGILGKRGVGVYGEEDGVFRESGVFLVENGGRVGF